jgi:serine/threonine-protein kinase TNNI3K
MPPLHIAAMCGFVDVLDALIASGANVNAQDWVKFSPLHVACYFGHEKVTKSLFEHGVNVNQPAGVKDVPIHLASAKGFVNIVQLLVSQGADGKIFFIPNHAQLLFGIFYFYKAKFNVTVIARLKDEENNGVLHFCCKAGHSAVLDVLLHPRNALTSTAHEPNIYGDTPLHL